MPLTTSLRARSHFVVKRSFDLTAAFSPQRCASPSSSTFSPSSLFRKLSTSAAGGSPPVSFIGTKHLLTLRDLSPPQILALVRRSLELKDEMRTAREQQHHSYISNRRDDDTQTRYRSGGGGGGDGGGDGTTPLAGKTLAMIFTKRSTRTRVSAETGWAHYGGHPMFLGKDDIQIGGGEPLRDTAIVVSSMVDAILARVGEHEEIETLAKNSTVPVINALTARFHPLQALADIMTLYETVIPDALNYPASAKLPLPLLPPLKVAWVGDANNIIHSLLVSLPRIGPISLTVATPQGYNCDPEVVSDAVGEATGGDKRGEVKFTRDPAVAVRDADFIITDTWVSMGQEAEKAKRLRDFAGYQVTEKMASGAKPDWKFMHCLPRKAEEVDDEVFYNPNRSIVFQEAENRKYTVMAVYEMLMLWAKN
ncbi:ornithine carbamoyltransferase [Geranomyces variabilis]|uniref:ornithine carbamoyltransferase n=1 Tax=Geranomyces variabilis TaxID=109894 RepID=A0AAD5TKB9_9FUNG|nr:ornithine carbamoyltransferase [Geranomyces variabilis]